MERVYEESLAHMCKLNGLSVERQLEVPIEFKKRELSTPLRLDLLINDEVIVECKASTEYHEIYEAQLLTYLRLMELEVGLVINFGRKLVKNGIHRVVNNFDE